jgi:hypothetical protein
MGEKGMWLKSTTAPATVIDDESLISTLFIGEGKDEEDS